jgi:alpha-L-fucosidase 2
MKRFLFFLALSCAIAHATNYTAVFKAPPTQTPTDMMPDGPLLGNGDVGVVLAGPPESQSFYIGKNDFWTRTPADAKVIGVGHIEVDIPALQGASYHQEQDMARAEVRGTFVKNGQTVRTRSWVQANENALFTELRCDGGQPISVSVRPTFEEQKVPAEVDDNDQPVNIGRELLAGTRWYFDGDMAHVVVTQDVLSGMPTTQPENVPHFHFDGSTTHYELVAPKMSKTVSVAAWIKINSASSDANYIVDKGDWGQSYSLGLSNGRLRWSINSTFVQTDQPLELGKWIYVVGTFDGGQMCVYVNGELKASLGDSGPAPGSSSFTRKADDLPGRSRQVTVATRVLGADGLNFMLKPGVPVTIATAIVSDLNAKDFQKAAVDRVAGLQPDDMKKLSASHRKWWADYWARSFIEIPDKQIEKHWYGALYILGSCSRAGSVAPGLFGNWVTTGKPAWHGDFHLNYDFESPYYIAFSSNHPDLTLPYYQAITESIPNGLAMAQRHGWKGVHFPVCIGPWGLSPENPDGDWGQRSDAAYAALDFIWYWQYTQDDAWLKRTGYPYLREVAAFWDDYLKFENGRYVDPNDSIQEGTGDDTNNVLSLGLIRTLYKNMIPMSVELGVDADKRAKWQDILDHLSDFPVQQRDGKTVFRYAETGMAWNDSNTLGIQHIFPAGAIGLDSDPKLLEISRNMIDEMNRWVDNNGFSSWFTACARVGYDPKIILAKLRASCDQHSLPNLLLSFGGVEECGGFLVINEMLLQSHEGVIRFFPCWPKDQDARFGNLRAVGAFLISAELKHGVVGGVTIVSEKGKDCAIVNPWPGRNVKVIRNGIAAEDVSGERFTLKTAANEKIEIQPD